MNCVWCHKTLSFVSPHDDPNGQPAWRHPDGSIIVQEVRRRCGDPTCNDLDHLYLVDDHVALADRRTESA